MKTTIPQNIASNLAKEVLHSNIKPTDSTAVYLIQSMKNLSKIMEETMLSHTPVMKPKGKIARFVFDIKIKNQVRAKTNSLLKSFKKADEEILGKVQIPVKGSSGENIEAVITRKSYKIDMNKACANLDESFENLPPNYLEPSVIEIRHENKPLGRIFYSIAKQDYVKSPFDPSAVTLSPGSIAINHIDTLGAGKKYDNVFETLTQAVFETAYPEKQLQSPPVYLNRCLMNQSQNRDVSKSALGLDKFANGHENNSKAAVKSVIQNLNDIVEQKRGFLFKDTSRAFADRLEKDGINEPGLIENLRKI